MAFLESAPEFIEEAAAAELQYMILLDNRGGEIVEKAGVKMRDEINKIMDLTAP